MSGDNKPTLLAVIEKDGAVTPVRATDGIVRLIGEILQLHRAGKFHRRILADEIFVTGDFELTLGDVEPMVILGGPGCDPNSVPPVLERAAINVPAKIDNAKKALLDAGVLLDPRQIDFYQLGTLLCLMLTGKGVTAYLRSCQVKSAIPEPMQKIIDRALGLNSTDCFSSAEEFLAAIQEVADLPINNLPFSHLAHYDIVDRIGHGGMGDVYKGYETSLERFVAIKVLPAELSRQEDFVKRFHAEAAAIARIDHPNVVRIFYNGEDQGYHFFAMQFVEGESLAELIKRQGKIDADQTTAIAEQCLAGLGAVHELGLIHRDVKPGNILLDRRSGKALVTDFGLVKRIQAQTQMTITGMVMGTADYIAPEQARGQEIDQRADLYAMGVMMYQMLAGKLPFHADTPTAMMFQHAYETPPPLAESSPEVPGPLVQIVMKLLEKNPEDRYQSADEVLSDLRQIEHPPKTAFANYAQSDCFETAAPTGFFTRLKHRLCDGFRSAKFFEELQTTQQQMNGAVAEYERRHKELTRLSAEAKAMLADLIRQKEQADLAVRLAGEKVDSATASDIKEQALLDRQTNEQTAAELAQLIAEQQEQVETIDLEQAKVTATLLRLRSQQNALNARLNAANMNLNESGYVHGTSLVTKVYCAAILICILSLGAYLQYALWPKNSLKKDLIARWTFDEGRGTIVHDATGKHHGNIYGNAEWGSGRASGALNFDGVDDMVDLGNDPAFDLGGKSFTIEAWVKTDDDHGGILSKHTTIWDGEWVFGVLRGHFRFGGSQEFIVRNSSVPINDGKWHHLTGVIIHNGKDENDLYQYIDGKLEGTLTHITDINSGLRNVIIGNENSHNWPFRGVIDELAIYNRALSAKEIQTLYQDVKGTAGETLTSINESKDNTTNDAIDHIQESPLVVKTIPEAFSNNVPSSLNAICVEFNQPMKNYSWSWTTRSGMFPKMTGKSFYNNERTICTHPVILEPGKVYWVGINSSIHKNFRNENRVPSKRYVILFATQGKDGKPTPIPESLLAQATAINAVSSGLVARWTFDEGEGEIVHDRIGKNDGVVHGAVWTKGPFGNGLKFDGVDDFVSLAKPAITSKEFSLAAWARTDGQGGGVEHSNPLFCQRSNRPKNNRSTVYLTAPTGVRPADESFMGGCGFVRSSQGSEQVLVSQPLNYSDWHFYVLTVNSTDIALYVDGQEVGRTANIQKGDYVSSIDYVFIGKHRYSQMDAGFFNGIIDDISIYDRALSAAEIHALHQIGLKGLTAGEALPFIDKGPDDTISGTIAPKDDTISENPLIQPKAINVASEDDTWSVIFRSDDPGIWDTDTSKGENHFAVPLQSVSSDIRWLRLKRMDTGEVIIIPMRKERLNLRIDLDETYTWNGTSVVEYKTTKGLQCLNRRLGIASRHLPARYHGGQIFIVPDPGTSREGRSGWGFGKYALVYSGQCYCWGGNAISKTVFEIAVKPDPLTDEDKRFLLPPR